MESSDHNVLFLDIGGVLLTNGWGHLSRQNAAKEFNIDYEAMNVLHEFIFNVYEVGSIDLEEYLNTVVFNQPRDFTKEDFKSFMFAQSVELPDMLRWLVEWKKTHERITVISINNEGKELNDYRIKKFRLHNCFDVFISSCDVGMRKPDPGIFKLAMGIAKVNPNQCYYFDDRAILADAARRLGINAFYHQTFEATKSIIEKIK